MVQSQLAWLVALVLLAGSVCTGIQAVAKYNFQQGAAHCMFLAVKSGTFDKAHSAVPEATY